MNIHSVVTLFIKGIILIDCCLDWTEIHLFNCKKKKKLIICQWDRTCFRPVTFVTMIQKCGIVVLNTNVLKIKDNFNSVFQGLSPLCQITGDLSILFTGG